MPIEHSQLVLRLLQEVATARATITTAYVRLWREGQSPAEPGPVQPGHPIEPDRDAGAARTEPADSPES